MTLVTRPKYKPVMINGSGIVDKLHSNHSTSGYPFGPQLPGGAFCRQQGEFSLSHGIPTPANEAGMGPRTSGIGYPMFKMSACLLCAAFSSPPPIPAKSMT